MRFEILSIDAWRDAEGGWSWNNCHKVGAAIMAEDDLTPRRILRWLRDAGFLTHRSVGRVRVVEIGGESAEYEIQARGTGEPLLALVGEEWK